MLSKWTADQTELVDSIKYNYYDHWYNIYTSQHCNDAVLRNQREENVKQVLVKVSNHETSYTGTDFLRRIINTIGAYVFYFRFHMHEYSSEL